MRASGWEVGEKGGGIGFVLVKSLRCRFGSWFVEKNQWRNWFQNVKDVWPFITYCSNVVAYFASFTRRVF